MRNKSTKWLMLMFLLACLALAAVACGGEKATTAPQPQATTAPDGGATAAPQPAATKAQPAVATSTAPAASAAATNTAEPTAGADVELDLSGLSKSTDLSSYRSTNNVTVKGTKDGKQVEESIEVKTEYTREPKAQHVSMNVTSSENVTSTGPIEIYQVESMQYMKMGEQWISTPVTDTGSLDTQGLITADQMLKDTCGWKKDGTDDLGGVRVQHWTLTKDRADKCTLGASIFGQGELTNAGGDLYVAIDGNYLAKMDLFYEGKNLGLFGTSDQAAVEEGRIDTNYTTSDVNQPFTIVVPDEALKSGALPEDIPVPADAEGASQVFGMINFKSPSTPKQIDDFYIVEMPNNGWTETNAGEFGGVYTREYTKGGRTASFMITADSASGKTQVLITVQGE